ncbi:MAG: outer membrane lipoprotein-sorting protein [Elusimicrobiota bacterium]
MNIKNIFVFFVVLFLGTSAYAQQEHSADEIVKKLDSLYRSDSSYAEIEMHIVTSHWERTLRMKAWSEGMEKTLIRITYPPREEGVATLRIENQMWNYLPKTNKVIKIPPSMMMSSWMGSDFTNNDLVKEFNFFDDYIYELITPEDKKEGILYLKLVPKQGVPVVWGKIISHIREKDYLPVKDEFFDEKGKLMRVMNYKEIKVFDDRKIPSVIELIPQDEKNNKTVIKYVDIDFGVKIPDGMFSLRSLRSGK